MATTDRNCLSENSKQEDQYIGLIKYVLIVLRKYSSYSVQSKNTEYVRS